VPELALREEQPLGDTAIATEHIVVGLVRVRRRRRALLIDRGVDEQAVRGAVLAER
jgi:hypothetical protein